MTWWHWYLIAGFLVACAGTTANDPDPDETPWVLAVAFVLTILIWPIVIARGIGSRL